ncbi:thiamine-phosphate kinase [bacterium]|nr:thiamine-phosphate kinase [bacterium]
MKEKEFISTIKQILNSEYIGDDCAFLKDLGIVVTQDSLVEDVHFKKDFITPYQLGYKSIMVNLSDISASGAEPKYITISLSLPSDIENNFVEQFYQGCKTACPEDVEIVGGDITSADKIYISVCAIGKTENRNISSRKNAKIGQKVVVSGINGSSGAGLELLLKGETKPEKFIKSHLEPQAQIEFGKYLGENIKEPYAAMDTSDGLMDALSTIANDSGVLLDINFDKIPYDKDIEYFDDWQNLVLFGGEDYQIIATVPQNINIGTTIGEVKQGLGVNLKIGNKEIFYDKKTVENNIYKHFK